MKKTSKVLKKRRAKLKARKIAIWKELNSASDQIESQINLNIKKVGIGVAGTLAGFVLFKAMTGGFNNKKAAKQKIKKSRVSKATSQLVFQAVNKLLPILIEKFTPENPKSTDNDS